MAGLGGARRPDRVGVIREWNAPGEEFAPRGPTRRASRGRACLHLAVPKLHARVLHARGRGYAPAVSASILCRSAARKASGFGSLAPY